jgi:hypothetical protein
MNKYGTPWRDENQFAAPWRIRECPKTWAIDTENGDGLVRLGLDELRYAELICAAPKMLEALKIAKVVFEARYGEGSCPAEIEQLLEEFSPTIHHDED